jgi:glucoamylase
VTPLQPWIEAQARFAARAMLGAISARQLVMERTGFGQRVIPRPGSVLASPVCAHYDPEPDYFFHWFRDSAIVIDALRMAQSEGYLGGEALSCFGEFVHFSHALLSMDGRKFLQHSNFRSAVQPAYREYLRPDAEIAALSGESVLADVRVNADGTPDITRWSRPQADGPAMRSIALVRWLRELPQLDATLRSVVREVIAADLAFTLSHLPRNSFDIWEEECGEHYYTRLVQSEACTQGAAWFAESGDESRAQTCSAAAQAYLPRLAAFWDRSAGFYRSRMAVTHAAPGKELDVAVILATLHAGRALGAHSVLDPKAQATLTALEELFEAEYLINRSRPLERGPAMGRYANDRYYSGGAYYFATLAAAEFYFSLAAALGSGAELMVVEENRRFRERLGIGRSNSDPSAQAKLAVERGDSFMRTVQAYTPPGGELSEQFDQSSGAQTSARQLSWSYAAFVTAAASRRRAHQLLA